MTHPTPPLPSADEMAEVQWFRDAVAGLDLNLELEGRGVIVRVNFDANGNQLVTLRRTGVPAASIGGSIADEAAAFLARSGMTQDETPRVADQIAHVDKLATALEGFGNAAKAARTAQWAADPANPLTGGRRPSNKEN